MNVEQEMDKREMSDKYQSAVLSAITDEKTDMDIIETMPISAVGGGE